MEFPYRVSRKGFPTTAISQRSSREIIPTKSFPLGISRKGVPPRDSHNGSPKDYSCRFNRKYVPAWVSPQGHSLIPFPAKTFTQDRSRKGDPSRGFQEEVSRKVVLAGGVLQGGSRREGPARVVPRLCSPKRGLTSFFSREGPRGHGPPGGGIPSISSGVPERFPLDGSP
jgi:hypothetical protein